MNVCKNCGRSIRWNEDLQRYDHIDTKYDGCRTTFLNIDARNTRAEPLR